MSGIPYGRQHITADDIRAVTETLNSDFLTQGPRIDEFEKAFAAHVQAPYAVAVSNGTAALHLSALALNIQPRDKVITSPISFSATANCVRYCGGELVFCDIDPATYLLDIEQVRKTLEADKNKEIKGIISVDFAGRAVNLEAFRKLADEFGLWILEDACHAPGGYFIDSSGVKQHCGNGRFADMSIFSFHPVKHIATGEGGMITCASEEVYERLKTLRTHGITRAHNDFQNTIELASGEPSSTSEWPGWYMELQELGYNYRLNDIQAALGTSQLKKADAGLVRRREIAAFYSEALKDIPQIVGHSGVVEGHAYHLFVIEAERRLELYNYLRSHQVYVQVHYIPIHFMPYYRQFGWKEGDMPKAEKYYKHCLSLPMFPTLTNQEQEKVIELIRSFYQ